MRIFKLEMRYKTGGMKLGEIIMVSDTKISRQNCTFHELKNGDITCLHLTETIIHLE